MHNVNTVITALTAVRKLATAPMSVLKIILDVGNYLNQHSAGGAQLIRAFKLESLQRLHDTKSADGQQTLLDWIVAFIFKHDGTQQT